MSTIRYIYSENMEGNDKTTKITNNREALRVFRRLSQYVGKTLTEVRVTDEYGHVLYECRDY